MADNEKSHGKPEGELAVKERQKTEKPKRYKVLLHNDDYTTMEFVVWVLLKHFGKTQTEATQIMLHVHTKGVGVCGVYTYDIAETKAKQVTDAARQQGHPLQCTMEPE